MKNLSLKVATAIIVSCPMFFVCPPALAGDVPICTALTEMAQKMVDARKRGVSEAAMIANISTTVSDPALLEAVIQAVHDVYRVNRKQLPLVARAVFKACIAQ
jgi:hypothetical protein